MDMSNENTDWAFLAVLNECIAGKRDGMTVGILLEAAVVVAEQSGRSLPSSSDIALQLGLSHLAFNGLLKIKYHESPLLAGVKLTARGSHLFDRVSEVQRGASGRRSPRKRVRANFQAAQLGRFRKVIKLEAMPSLLQIIQDTRRLSNIAEEEASVMADSLGLISRILRQPTPPPNNDDRAKLDARKEALKVKRESLYTF